MTSSWHSYYRYVAFFSLSLFVSIFSHFDSFFFVKCLLGSIKKKIEMIRIVGHLLSTIYRV